MTTLIRGRTKTAAACSLLVGMSCYAASAVAQQALQSTVCRAGTVSVLAKGEQMFIFAIDQRGVMRAEDAGKHFDNATQRCVGTVSIIAGKQTGGGYCKTVDPATGDFTATEWTAGDKGAGTWRYVQGTGKWKGITGGGTYQPFPPNRAVDDGTYQNCVSVKGTFAVP